MLTDWSGRRSVSWCFVPIPKFTKFTEELSRWFRIDSIEVPSSTLNRQLKQIFSPVCTKCALFWWRGQNFPRQEKPRSRWKLWGSAWSWWGESNKLAILKPLKFQGRRDVPHTVYSKVYPTTVIYNNSSEWLCDNQGGRYNDNGITLNHRNDLIQSLYCF